MELPDNTHKQTSNTLNVWISMKNCTENKIECFCYFNKPWERCSGHLHFLFQSVQFLPWSKWEYRRTCLTPPAKHFLLSSCDTLREKNSQWRDLLMHIVPCFHSRLAQSWAFQRQGKTLWVHGIHSPLAVSPHPLLLFQQCSKEQKKPLFESPYKDSTSTFIYNFK